MPFDRKEGVVALFAMTLGRGIMIRDIVCPHVRWAGRPWVVISKTLGEPVNGLSTASLPAWFPRLPGGELQIRRIKIHYFIQIAVDGESVRRSFKLRRIRLPSTADETGEMLYGTTNVF